MYGTMGPISLDMAIEMGAICLGVCRKWISEAGANISARCPEVPNGEAGQVPRAYYSS